MNEIFDAATALEQAGGNEELARELFSMLLNELPDHRQAIDAAFRSMTSETAAIDGLWDSVHKLYGAAAYLGVPALRGAAKTLEDQIRENARDQLAEGIRQLDQEIERLLNSSADILARDWSGS